MENLGDSKSEIVPKIEGEKFETYGDFYKKYLEKLSSKVFLIDKSLEGNEIIDSHGQKLQIRFHKITPDYGNVNVYKDGNLATYFRLNNSNIQDFLIQIE